MLEFDQAIMASNERIQALEANHVHALTEKDQLHTLVITGAIASKPYQTIPTFSTSKYLPCVKIHLH